MSNFGELKISAPAGWQLKHDSRPIRGTYNQYEPNLERPKFTRKGVFAGHCTDFESCHTIELREHYNGSGKSAFGGAESWPVVDAQVAFNDDEYEMAARFAKDLADFVDAWLTRHDR